LLEFFGIKACVVLGATRISEQDVSGIAYRHVIIGEKAIGVIFCGGFFHLLIMIFRYLEMSSFSTPNSSAANARDSSLMLASAPDMPEKIR
jgi:hypothetical protein